MTKYAFTISSDTVSTYTPVILFENAKENQITARATKTKLLDGTVMITNFGSYEADRDLVINRNLSQTEFDALKDIMLNCTAQHVLTSQGAFAGIISELSETKIKFLCSSKIA
jgi:hypothetical protein